MKFEQLTDLISETNTILVQKAGKSVNSLLTIRNWLIGYRIFEYEQHGEDRAEYGKRLIPELSQLLEKKNVPSCSEPRLHAYRQFYKCYPEILSTLSRELYPFINQGYGENRIFSTVSRESQENNKSNDFTPRIPIDTLIRSIPFSAFAELIKIDDILKRSFYEVECIKGQWSTRELRRQIVTLYYERSAYSTDKKKLSYLVHGAAHTASPKDLVKDPYVFEFLGIKPQVALRENDLRDALLDKVQEFLLEMGKGFCFEARNKRILIGEKYRFIDIVLYHRILKRSILIELKIDEATHENIGQLNTYLSYYKKHEMHEGDNPPIGILLCTQKEEALIEYAQMDVDHELFVSNYQFALPEIKTLQAFVEESLHELHEINDAF